MLARFFTMLVSSMLGRAMGDSESASQFVGFPMDTLRRVAGLLTMVATAVLLFVAGVFTVLVDMILQTRALGYLALTQASIVGFALIVLSALYLVTLAFREKSWGISAPALRPEDQPSPLNGALAELVRDFVKERQVRREANAAQSSERFTEHVVEEPTSPHGGAETDDEPYRAGRPLHI